MSTFFTSKLFAHARKGLLCLLTLGATAPAAAEAIADQGEYYIVSDYFNMALGVDAEKSNTPALSVYGTVEDTTSYVFIAEASSTNGYYYLKNKSTGRYLTASTSDTWSLVWKDTKGTGTEFLWKLDVQLGRNIVSRKNPQKMLGIDWSEDDFIHVFYDKSYNSTTLFSVVPVIKGGLSASLAATQTEVFKNSIGRNERDIYCVSDAVTVDSDIDLHLMGETPFIEGGSVDLKADGAWLIFDKVQPVDVVKKYLKYVKVNGAKAKYNTNIRTAIYLEGTALIPTAKNEAAFIGYTDTQLSGDKVELTCKNNKTLDADNNTIRSFTLKRGYMAVVASGENQSGYTRVFVADHSDLDMKTLPDALDRRISSVYVRKWNYTSKKGWCSTKSDDAIKSHLDDLDATWFYTWSADRASTSNYEYVPIRQHKYWPSVSDISKVDATHVLGINEPEHSEQHDDCSCGGTVDAWTATTLTPDMAPLGMRVGSPAPTDLSWLTSYAGHVDDMAYRCDYVVLHAYWGPNEANGTTAWYNKLKDVYDKTGRPIWITEWAYGASWTTETWPSTYSEQLEKNRAAIFDIVNMLENCPFVERYSYYQWDTSSRRFINDDGWMTPAGHVYKNIRSTFAYNADYQKVPNWWRPSAKVSTLAYEAGENDNLTFTIGNTNGDCTATIALEAYDETTGEWTAVYTYDNRSALDAETLTFSLPASQIPEGTTKLRLRTTTLFGSQTLSEEAEYSYTPSAITTVTTDDTTSSAEAYTLDGRSVKNAAGAHGIVILKDGTKVLRSK